MITLAVALVGVGGHHAHAQTNLGQARFLKDVQIRDAYQLDSTDPTKVSAAGVLVFLYRELVGCEPGEECRRLALAWIPPNGEVIELQVLESELSGGNFHGQKGGVGLGSGNHFAVSTPQSLRSQLGETIKIATGGLQGESLTVRPSDPSARALVFKRLLGLQSPKLSKAAILQIVLGESVSGPKQPMYVPAMSALRKTRQYAVFHGRPDHKGIVHGAILSRPSSTSAPHDWQVGLFDFDIQAHRLAVQAAFHGYLVNRPELHSVWVDPAGSEIGRMKFPALHVAPGLETIKFEKYPAKRIADLGDVLTPITSNVIVKIEADDPSSPDPDKLVRKEFSTHTFSAAVDRDSAANWVEMYVLALRQLQLRLDTPTNSFYAMVHSLAAGCQNLLKHIPGTRDYQYNFSKDENFPPSYLNRFRTGHPPMTIP